MMTAAELLAEVDTLIKNERSGEALALLEQGAERFPNDVKIIVKLSYRLSNKKQHARAERILRAALNNLPDNRSLIFALGNVLFNDRQYAEAEAIFRKALSTESDNSYLCGKLSLALYKQEKFNEAKTVLEEALDRDPTNPYLKKDLAKIFRRFGEVSESHGNTAEAEANWREAFRLDPTHIDGIKSLAQILKKRGNLAEAAQVLNEGYRIDKTDPAIINMLGHALAAQGKYAEAERLLGEGRRLDPTDSVTINTLGHALAAQGKYAEAERVLGEGRRLDPTDIITINTLGFTYLKQRKYKEFDMLVQSAAAIGKNSTTYFYMVATGAFLRHEPERAARFCKQGMELEFNPNLVVLYMAAVPEESDPFRSVLKTIVSPLRYQNFSARAAQIQADDSLLDELDPKYSPRISPVTEGIYIHPVNGNALRAVVPYGSKDGRQSRPPQ
jgi:tetratricopeptide (TPR) repeat protein